MMTSRPNPENLLAGITRMICPQCNLDFVSAADARLPTHNCPGCGGTWIRGKSLHALLAQSDDSSGIEQTLDSILSLDFKTSRRRCPSCVDCYLKAVVIENTELDFCANCKGLFFDPGELRRVFPGLVDQDKGSQTPETRGFWATLLKFIDYH